MLSRAVRRPGVNVVAGRGCFRHGPAGRDAATPPSKLWRPRCLPISAWSGRAGPGTEAAAPRHGRELVPRVARQVRCISTSGPRLALPLKAIAARLLWTRFVRTAWLKATTEKQRAFFRRRVAPALVLGIVGSAVGMYYCNQEVVPASGRRRFMWISREREIEIGNMTAENMRKENFNTLLPKTDPRTLHTASVLWRIVHRFDPSQSAVDGYMLEHPWSLHVIESPQQNAFVLPGGFVFVYTGILDSMNNDDELANCLAHEMAHVLARHGAENMSWLAFFGLAQIVVLSCAALVLPLEWDIGNLLASVCQEYAVKFLITLPHNRQREVEADYIGQRIAARACYDPWLAADFWDRFASKDLTSSDWSSTHPSSSSRRDYLTEHAEDANAFGRLNGDCDEFLAFLEAAGRKRAKKPLTKSHLELLGAFCAIESTVKAPLRPSLIQRFGMTKLPSLSPASPAKISRIVLFDKAQWMSENSASAGLNKVVVAGAAAALTTAGGNSVGETTGHVGVTWDPTVVLDVEDPEQAVPASADVKKEVTLAEATAKAREASQSTPPPVAAVPDPTATILSASPR